MGNTETIPAAGNLFTAEDYAKLILAIFDTVHLSASRITDIVTPIIRIDNSLDFYGPGFEVVHNGKDIIIAHGGENPGFRNQMWYSVTGRCGLVFLTNSEKGKTMDRRLCEMTTGIDISDFLSSSFYFIAQYPDPSLQLLQLYIDSGYSSMSSRIDLWRREQRLSPNTLNLLTNFFMARGGDPKVAKDLLEKNITFYPDSPMSYALLGELSLEMNDIDLAYRSLMKAKALQFQPWDLGSDLNEYEKKSAEAKRRSGYLSKVAVDTPTRIEAEDYNAMSMVRIEHSFDQDSGRDVGYINSGDWMEYKLNVVRSGSYKVTFRVASLPGGGKIELRSDSTVIAKVSLPSTKGWQSWTSVSTLAKLPAGEITLRLNAVVGSFNINWLQFTPFK